MLSINVYLPYIGIIILLYGWCSHKVNTHDILPSLSFIVYGVIWIFLYLADINPLFSPTWGSVMARLCMILFFVLYILQLRRGK